MTRLQKKCFLFSAGMHGLLGVILVLSSAFRDKPATKDMPILTMIPSKILDEAGRRRRQPEPAAAGATRGSPPPPVRPAAPQPLPPSARGATRVPIHAAEMLSGPSREKSKRSRSRRLQRRPRPNQPTRLTRFILTIPRPRLPSPVRRSKRQSPPLRNTAPRTPSQTPSAGDCRVIGRPGVRREKQRGERDGRGHARAREAGKPSPATKLSFTTSITTPGTLRTASRTNWREPMPKSSWRAMAQSFRRKSSTNPANRRWTNQWAGCCGRSPNCRRSPPPLTTSSALF